MPSTLLSTAEEAPPGASQSCDSALHTLRTILRFLIGGLLLLAAWLKAISPDETATLATAYSIPTWVSVLLVQLEIALAVLLLLRIWPRATISVAAFVFACFALFSLYRATSGAESCGCFGSLKVNPWITFGLDLLVLVALFWLRSHSHEPAGSGTSRLGFAAALYLLCGVPPLAYMLYKGPISLSENALLSPAEGGLVILEPENWIDQPFPLTPYLSPRADCSTGRWIVLLYHHDCPKCQDALPQYVALATRDRVLLIEVPPLTSHFQSFGEAVATRLSEDREWFVQAPVEIQLNDGKVALVSLDLPSIADQ